MALRRIRHEAILNASLGILVAAAFLVVIRAAGHLFPVVELGIFLIVRRYADSLSNLIQLGMPLGLKRYLSLVADRDRHRSFILLATTMVLGSSAAWLIVGQCLSATWLATLFPANTPTAIVLVTIGLAAALALNNLALSSLTAYRRYVWLNVVNFANGSGWMLVALFLYRRTPTVVAVLGFHAAASATLSCLTLGTLYLTALSIPKPEAAPAAKPGSRLHELIAYGLPRTPGPFVETLVLSAALWLLRGEPAEAGYLAIALSLLRIVNAAVMPISDVAAVATAGFVGRDQRASIERGVTLMLGSLLYSSTIAACIGLPWIKFGLHLWLGNPALEVGALGACTVATALAVPFTLFQGLKGQVDMIWPAPRNLYSAICAIVALFGAWVAVKSQFSMMTATLIALTCAIGVLAAVTLLWLRPYLAPRFYFDASRLTALGGTVIAANALAAWVSMSSPPTLQITALGLAVVASGSLTLATLRRSPPARMGRELYLLLQSPFARTPAASGSGSGPRA